MTPTFPPSLPPSLVEVFRRRAEEHPERLAFVFLADGEEEGERLTYGALDLRARAIALRLEGLGLSGERALLLFPPGLDFVAAFLGCLYAGVVAVPAYPPRSRRLLPRLQAIAADARPRAALTVASLLPRLSQAAAELPGLAGVAPLATDEIDPWASEVDAFRATPLEPSDLAFLQYTSGSTATPKGVEVTHGNLVHNEEMIRRAFEMSEESVVVGWLPLYHDMGLIGNVLQPLYAGGSCVLMAPVSFLQRPRRWLAAISRYRATTSGGPDFAYELCARRIGEEDRRGLDLASWRVAYNGAEPVRAETLEQFTAAFAPAGFRREAFYPCYGLAEATLFVTGGRVGTEAPVADLAGRPRVSCGSPWLGQEVAIVDPETCRRLPGEQVGEIWVAGESVAAGYWGQPEATERDFRARLAEEEEKKEDGRTWLRTGDLGVLRGGELFVTGRAKDLIILRGRNLYPQDLEASAAASHPALVGAGGAAFSAEVAGEERLVLVHEIAGRPGPEETEEVTAAIRRAVAEEHEAQVWDVVLLRAGTLPRTSSGKVQRHACRAGYLAGTLEAVGRSALSGPAPQGAPAPRERPGPPDRPTLLALPREQRRAALEPWLTAEAARRLRLPQVDPAQPLSGMGLDSLSAVELRHAIEEALGVSPALSGFLEGWSVRDLAALILAEIEGDASPLPALVLEGEEPGEHPLSEGQRGLWFLSRLAPESGAYNIIVAARVRGKLDAPALERSLAALVARHAALRTTFPVFEGEPRRRVGERGELDFQVMEDAALAAEGYRPFDLERGPLLRVRVLRRPPAEDAADVLLLAVHHLVSDFASLAVMAEELAALYAGVTLSPVVATYGDFVRWQREILASPEGARQEAYWRERLGGELPVLDLPADRPRPPVQTDRGGAVSLHLPAGPLGKLKELGLHQGATLYMILLAAFQTLLHRYTGEEDLLVGSPIAGRNAAPLARVVGYFVNTLVLRSDLGGDPPFTELLGRVRRTALDAFAHPDLPFPRLAEQIQPVRDPSRPPVFQVLLVLQSGPAPLAAFALGEPGIELAFADLSLEPLPLPERRAQFDLTLMAAELGDRLAATLEYNADLFDRGTAERMAGHLKTLLSGIAERPDDPLSGLPILAAAERAQIRAWSEGEGEPGPRDACLHELVFAQAARTPEAEALVFQDERLTYAALATRAGRLARRLRHLGVGPEVRVAISARRSPDLVAGLLGILEAGGAYVPMEPALPDERLAFLLGSSGARLLLTEPALEDRFRRLAAVPVLLLDEPEDAPHAEPAALHPENLAYLIYTSGSTGEPKGVAISHASAVALVRWARKVFPAADFAGVLASTSIGFDLSVFELFVPLAWGGRVILAADALELPRLPAAREVTLVNTVPSVLSELLRAAPLPRSVRTVNLAGEPLPGPLVRQVRTARVLNLYGPSEDTTYSTFAEIDPAAEGAPPIGRPLTGTRAWVLDRRLQPVPVGVPGELFLGGRGLARGYLGRPDLTAERFVPDPLGPPGERLYRTGDLARFRPNGHLEYLGRLDHQVKVRGFRIELGEIEAALAAHPGVAAAAALAEGEGPDRRLVAFLAAPGASPTLETELRSALRARLPEYMVPALFIFLDALPLTPNGKVDRRALTRQVPAPRAAAEGRTPQGPIEERLAAIWSDLLGVESPTAQASFFDLGGHSLLATRLLARVRTAFGVDLSLPSLFAAPTLAGFAARIAAARASVAAPPPPIAWLAPGEPRPLSFAQRRLWFLHQLDPESPAYNMPAVLSLSGALSVPALRASLAEIVRRHEILRTTFVVHGEEPIQAVDPSPDLSLPELDLTALPAPAREAEAGRIEREEARRPFDLGRSLRRFQLLRLTPAEHRLLINLHHAAADGWSLGILVAELSSLYEAPSSLPELPVQFGDYAAWQRRWAAGEGDLDWWRERLAGPLPVLRLTPDRPGDGTGRGAVASASLSADTDAALTALARRHGATRFMVLAAGLYALFHRYTGEEDFLVGTPVANRRQPEVMGLIGPFLNLLPLRADLSGDPSFEELVGRVRIATLGALAHQDLPFERLVEELHPERGLARGPLFQVLLALEEAPLAPPALPDLSLAVRPLSTGTAKFDLSLTVTGPVLAAEYATDLYDAPTIERLLADFGALLEAALADPGRPLAEIPFTSPAAQHQVVAPRASRPPSPVHRAPTFVPPNGPVEESLAGIWRDLLGIERIGREDSFFDVGGHSLLATRLLLRVRAAFGVDLPLPVLAEASTLSRLARRIEEALGETAKALPPVLPAPRPAPLSFGQRRLWFLHQLDPESPAYNMPAAVRLRGPLDIAALAGALGEIVSRHEALRTRILLEEEEPLQTSVPPSPFVLPLASLSSLPGARREAEARRFADAAARLPFVDLARSAPCRFRLIHCGPDDHLLLANFHHLVADGWSLGIFVRELSQLYPALAAGRRDRPGLLPTLPVQYADWAVWQRRWAAGEEELAWWRERLAGELPDAPLPADRPRPASPSGHGAIRSLPLPPGLSPTLAALAREERATLFMALAAGFLALLSRFTGADDLLVGIPVANRRAPEVEDLIGFFVNTVVLRGDLSGRPGFRTLLGRVREEVLAAHAHQDLPFERLVETLNRRDLFPALFHIEEPLLDAVRLPGLSLERLEAASGTAKFDLTLTVTRSGDTLGASLEYATDLFDATTAQRLLDAYATLLSGVAAEPERPIAEIELVTAAQRHQIQAEWNDTAAEVVEESLEESFLRQVERAPDATAVSSGDEQVSYGELERRSGRVAGGLGSIGPEGTVGLEMERSIELIVAMLGVVRAGGVYVPIDPEYPRERREKMIADSRASVILSEAKDLGEGSIPPPRSFAPLRTTDGLAYLIYTSGSTGEPKGVAVPQRAIQRLVLGPNFVKLSSADRIAQASTPSFDAATFEIWGSLLNGARLEIFPPGPLSLSELAGEIRRSGVTVLWLTAGLFHQMVESHLEDLAGVRQLLAGGDVLSPIHVERARQALPGCRLVNGYGPTENTTFTCCEDIQAADPALPVPLGRPISGTTVSLLDSELRPVPIGVTGELHAGGSGLARGYWGDPARTAERFLPDPAGAPGARLYRTGDRARFRADGRIDFLGRLDRQVKIRGFRIEPGEVEAALASHPAVRQAAVDVRPDPAGGKRLVAWVVTDPVAPIAALRAHLLDLVPVPSVPSVFVPCSSLPLTPQGKLDRRALPEPEEEPHPPSVSPGTPFEEVLAAIWSEVLGRDQVGATDDFFSLGGHSLLATRVASRVRAAFGVDLPLSALFEAPTLAALASRIEEALRAAGEAGAPPVPPVEPAPRDRPLPLSFSQERLWFLDQLEPESPFYNISGAVRLEGRLAPPALAAALAAVTARHEALRTTFIAFGGEPRQRIAPPGPFVLPGIDLSALPEPARERESLRLAAFEAARPFDLERGPLLRATLLRLGAEGAESQALVLVVHHIVADGWSMEILLREVIAAYASRLAGHPAPLPPLPVQYADFAVWQRRWLSGAVLARQLAHWRTALAGAPAVLALPADRPRPARQSFAGGEVRSFLSPETRSALVALARREGASLFMVLAAAFSALLSRHTGQEDLTLGTPVANRGRREIEGLIGFFVNTLVLRGDLSGDPSFSVLLARIRRTALDAYAHEDLPFEKLVAELAPPRDASHHPLFQVLLSLEDLAAGPAPPRLPGLALLPLAIPETAAKFDLSLVAKTVDGGLRITWSYARALFDRTTLARLAAHFEILLSGLLADPSLPQSSLPLLSAAERQQVAAEWNDTRVDFGPEPGLHELLALRSAGRPDRVALTMAGEHWSFGEVEARSNRLAHHLTALGLRAESRVAVFLPRTPESVIALLALWKAGGTYLPLPVSYPSERLAFILGESEPGVVLTRRDLLGRLPELPEAIQLVLLDAGREALARSSEGPLATPVPAGQLATLFYTSGSTGRPKGVMVSHGSLVNFLLAYEADVRLGPADVMPAWTLPSFDPSLLEWLTPLLAGARVLVVPEEDLQDLPALTRALRESTALDGIPSLYRQIVLHLTETGQTAGWEHIRTATLGGESVSGDLLAAMQRIFPRAELRNSYGPTETAVLCTSYPAHSAGIAGDVIGRPLANMALRLLDRAGQPVPIGVPGEIWIGGKGVGRGYFRRPDLTAERFTPDPGGQGGRAFKTGDLARLRPDGTIEFLGRIDNQVKIRGLRIELGEIEATLALHPDVAEAAVLARDEGGSRRLVAYVSPRPGAELAVPELRALAALRLPDYMVPAAFVLLDRLPRSSHGKLDRGALPAPERPRPEGAHAAPRTALERAIAAVWQDLLSLREGELGIDDNFFELGGDSLLLLRLRSRLQAAVGRELPVVALFQYPTIRSLAESLERERAAPAAAAEAVEARTQTRRESLARLSELRGQRRKKA